MPAHRRFVLTLPCVAAVAFTIAPLSAVAQRTMTAADVRMAAPSLTNLRAPEGGGVEAALQSRGAAAALGNLLAGSGAALPPGISPEEAAAAAAALQRDVIRDLVARVRALPPGLEAGTDDTPTPGTRRPHGPAASADVPRLRPVRTVPRSLSVFQEGERLVRLPEGGFLTNVRMEFTRVYEGRRVGVRIDTRTTIERNPALRSSKPAAEQYVVESGTSDPGTGQRTLDKSGTRRLRPTSDYRMTTTMVREAKVDRCPDPAGQSRGTVAVSLLVRGTAAASGTGAPVTFETTARAALVGQVDDAANLAGYDLDFTVEHRTEAVGSRADFRVGTTATMGLHGDTPVSSSGPVTIQGYGSAEEGATAGKLMNSATGDAFGPVTEAFDMAKSWWRTPGGCYELVAASGATPARLKPGERRQLVIRARHKEEPSQSAVPVSGKASLGSLTPATPVNTPDAGFTYVHPGQGSGSSTLTFSSTSRRGIAPDLAVTFSTKAGETIPFRMAYVGYKFVEGTAEDCPDMRPAGREVLTAELRLVSKDPDGSARYEGPGRLSADIDGCGLTPNRDDPGMVEDRPGAPGGFGGDNFLGCKVTTVVPEHAVQVSVEVNMVDVERPNYVMIEWTPTAGHVGVGVSTGCEPAYQAGYVKDITQEYRREQRRQITDYDLLPRLAPGGRLREGVYRSPDVEELTITIGEVVEIPSLVDH